MLMAGFMSRAVASLVAAEPLDCSSVGAGSGGRTATSGAGAAGCAVDRAAFQSRHLRFERLDALLHGLKLRVEIVGCLRRQLSRHQRQLKRKTPAYQTDAARKSNVSVRVIF